MGKVAHLIFVQKAIIEPLHKEIRPQKVIAKEAGLMENSLKGKSVVRKCAQATKMIVVLRIVES